MNSGINRETLLPEEKYQLYAEIVESSQELVWQCDVTGKCQYLNPAWETTLGFSLNEMMNKSLTDLQTPETAQKSLHFFRRILLGETIRGNEIVLFSRSGESVNLVISGFPVKNENGTIIGARGSAYNITYSKRTEETLRSITARQTAILAAVPDIIAEVNNDKVYTWMNRAGLEFFGESALGKEAAIFFEGDQNTYSTVQPLFDGDNSVIYVESWQRRKDGSKRLLAWWCRVLKDEYGMVTGALSTARDITISRQSEIALANEKERLSVTLRSIGDAVIATNKNGTIMLMNKIAEELTGWCFAEAENKPLISVFNIINEITRQPCDNPVDKVLQSGCVVGLANHTALIRRDGTEITIADSGAPIRSSDNSIIGVVLVFRDITEKSKTERALQNAQKLESIGILAGGIAHDFNNLLGGIFGFVDIAKEKIEDEVAAYYLTKALSTINRARGLTHQLLTFSKGGTPIRKKEYLKEVIQETVQFALSGSNVSSNFSIDKDLWPCEFDRNQIVQVIDNIVINAQQAMPEGGIIYVEAKNLTLDQKTNAAISPGPYVLITITDHGTGIPPEIITKIFDPFFTTKQKGHGLGLAICHSIISQHGGKIEVESVLGKGSNFHIYLPAVPDGPISETTENSFRHKGSGTIVVMDDEEVIRETISEMLSSMGYTVICTRNCQETLAYLNFTKKCNAKITAFIIDLTIPGEKGGIEVVAEIRQVDNTVPVFVSSGYAEDPAIAHPEKFGFTASICKPFRTIDLARLLNANLKHQG